MKRLAILVAAAALALTPSAAVAKHPARDGAKVERTAKAKRGVGHSDCRAAKTTPSGRKARGKKARAAGNAFGRCVSQEAKRRKAERKAQREADENEDAEDLEDYDDEDLKDEEPEDQKVWDELFGNDAEGDEPDSGVDGLAIGDDDDTFAEGDDDF